MSYYLLFPNTNESAIAMETKLKLVFRQESLRCGFSFAIKSNINFSIHILQFRVANSNNIGIPENIGCFLRFSGLDDFSAFIKIQIQVLNLNFDIV